MVKRRVADDRQRHALAGAPEEGEAEIALKEAQ